MKDIALYGAGGLGREIACVINRINKVSPTWNLIGFFDDGKEIGEEVSHFGKCLGGINELNNWPSSLSIVLCFGAPKTIKYISEKINNHLIDFPNLIDPSCIITDTDTFNIGVGNVFQANCLLTTDVSIGNFNLFNGSVSIGHDTKIGNFNVLMPGVKVSGEIAIGKENLFGTNSFIKQQLKIGDNVTLSPLSALLTKPKDNSLYVGNPAKKIVY